MKTAAFLTLFLILNINGFTQTMTFDSIAQKWTKIEYYRGGAVASIKKLEKDGFTFTDTFKVYFTNGNPVYEAMWKNNTLTGSFKEFYINGKTKKTGEFYNFFMTDLWTEFYENGQMKSQGKYVMTKNDLAVKDPTYLDSRIVYDTIVYPDVVMVDSIAKVVDDKIVYTVYVDSNQVRKDMLLTIPTLKDGIWKYWNDKGDLINEEIYKKGILTNTKKQD